MQIIENAKLCNAFTHKASQKLMRANVQRERGRNRMIKEE